VERSATPWLYRHRPFVTVSNSSRNDLVAMGLPSEVITVVRNGVGSSPTGTPSSPTPRLCVLSRLVPHKQIEHAFAVLERVRADHPEARLDVIGEGWWHDELVTDVGRRGLEEAVTFHGHVPETTRDELLAAAWVMLLPSVKEGWGLAVLEAAMQATPTVAYREAGGVAESVVHGETGLLATSMEELHLYTRRLLEDGELRERMSRTAQARAATFSWSDAADAVESVLKQA
jgi:glycosyltransferase involved in cell wall biosynthesis